MEFFDKSLNDLHLNQLNLESVNYFSHTAQKMKFSIKDFFSKYDQIYRKLRIWSHLLNKSLMENFVFCAVKPKDRSSFLPLITFTYFFHNSYLPTEQKVILTKFSSFYYRSFVFIWTVFRIICSNSFTRNNFGILLIFLLGLASPIFHLWS